MINSEMRSKVEGALVVIVSRELATKMISSFLQVISESEVPSALQLSETRLPVVMSTSAGKLVTRGRAEWGKHIRKTRIYK